MVLIPKLGKALTQLSVFRPICLLDEMGKLFEKVLVARLTRHLPGEKPDLHEKQYRFRAGRSTVDAILRVRSLALDIV